jgi:hypothetical protein
MASLAKTACGPERTVRRAWGAESKGSWWPQHREASLNWLALGLLLAAWNAADNDCAARIPRRPQALRGYPSVSVRAARHAYLKNMAQGIARETVNGPIAEIRSSPR